MDYSVTLIGFGEAAIQFAEASPENVGFRAFDILTGRGRNTSPDGHELCPKYSDYANAGVIGCSSNAQAAENSRYILSLVTADQALAAARTSAQSIARDAFYFDMNSVAPDTKRAAADLIDGSGGRYVDVAIMAPVDPFRLAVPLLVSGPYAQSGAAALMAIGFTDVRVVGSDIGLASSIKMIRSVMVKGQEALTAEMMLAAENAGVVDEVLESLGDSWHAKAAYNLGRMRKHGRRRAAEMEEVAKTLSALGIEPLMTSGTIQRQREMAQMKVKA